MKDTVIQCVTGAGRILLEHLGNIGKVIRKESQSSVVTIADLAAERCIVELIRRRYPDDNILAEESGFRPGASAITWVIDPLDGPANFAAGIPWFGVLVAVLQDARPILAAAYLPEANILYLAEQGQGVYRNGCRVCVTAETDLSNVLCSYGMDSSSDERQTRQAVRLLTQLVNRVRNVRATNSLVDFCYVIDGRFGAAINQSTKIWDIAPISLMLQEAGGTLTDFQGKEIAFFLEPGVCAKTYSVLGASAALSPQVLDLIKLSSLRVAGETW
jgi:myo-inositol-1(or 4)-monophosphatase